jgi:phenylalanyl-tRNA synthetase beta chain
MMMKVSISWLRDYVDIDVPIEELAERLTMAGLEVEAIQYIGIAPARQGPGGLHSSGDQPSTVGGMAWDRDKIVVGQILRVDPHPNADRLTLATVDYGGDQPLTVVTGAPNVKMYEGAMPDHPLKIAFAVVGARLIDGHYDDGRLLKLKATKIRGVRSEGMVCSEKELGLSDEHEGILYLPDDAPVGVPLADYLGDVVLEFDIKGPFAHLHSVVSIAREVAALTGKPYRRDVLTILDREPVELVPGPGNLRPGAVPALCGGDDPWGKNRPLALLDATTAPAGRDAAHQQHRGHHQLRDAGTGPASPRL